MEEIKIAAIVVFAAVVIGVWFINKWVNREDRRRKQRAWMCFPFRVVETSDGSFWIQEYRRTDEKANPQWGFRTKYADKESALAEYYRLMVDVVYGRMSLLSEDERNLVASTDCRIKDYTCIQPDMDKLNTTLHEGQLSDDFKINRNMTDYLFSGTFVRKHLEDTKLARNT